MVRVAMQWRSRQIWSGDIGTLTKDIINSEEMEKRQKDGTGWDIKQSVTGESETKIWGYNDGNAITRT